METENHITETEFLQNNSQDPKPISGWLTFFLWVGVGLGALISCVLNLAELMDIGFTPLSALLFAGYLGSLLIIAILTIFAFYKRQPNAVSLAVTYVLMIAFSGITQIAIATIIDDITDVMDIVRPIVWSAIWFAYLVCSQQVKEQIPVETRCWKTTEKVLLTVFVVSCITLCVEMRKMMTDPTNSNLISKEYLIKQTVESMNEQFPQYADGMIIEGVELQGSMIVYSYRFPNTALADMNVGHINKYSVASKQELMQGYALETDKDVIKIYDWFFNSGYDMCYTYKDKNNQVVYSVVMTPADYTKAKESGLAFRCDRNAWNEILSQVEKDLPMSYMGDCFLKEVSVDFENNVLNYVVALPDNVFSLYITEEYIENYIKENMEALSDYLWTMAGIDKMDLHYHFVTASGKARAKIVIPCGEYK